MLRMLDILLKLFDVQLIKSAYVLQEFRFFMSYYCRFNYTGPNVYRIPGTLDKLRYQRCYSDLHGAFNSTDERRVSLASKEAFDLPGPAHYTVDKVPTRVKTTRLTSSFASFKPRLVLADEKV